MKAKHTLIIYTIGNTRGLGQRAPWKREDDGEMEAGDVGMIMAGEVADISPASGGWGLKQCPNLFSSA